MFDYSVLFEQPLERRNDGLTIIGGHGVSSEQVDAVLRDESVKRAYEAAKYRHELVMAQASLYQSSPFDWND